MIQHENISRIVAVLAGVFALGLLIGFFISVSVGPSGNVNDTPTDTPDTPMEHTSTSTESKNPQQSVVKAISNTIKKTLSLPTGEIQTVMGWIYPGEPACTAMNEIADGRIIDVIKPEYFLVNFDGTMEFLTEETAGCNGFSDASLALIQSHSTEQYVTVASADASAMATFLQADSQTGAHVETLVNFVVLQNMTGVELDFEDFSGWSPEAYSSYKDFVKRLGTALHAQDKKLMLDGPPIADDVQQGWYQWRYEDFRNLPVDYMVVMAYDYQFDHGVGNPVTPHDWLRDVSQWALDTYGNREKLVIGLPLYGYTGRMGTQDISILTYEQAQSMQGFSTATRDPESGEMLWQSGNTLTVYQDTESVQSKIDIVLDTGIENISLWHLGGNQWIE